MDIQQSWVNNSIEGIRRQIMSFSISGTMEGEALAC